MVVPQPASPWRNLVLTVSALLLLRISSGDIKSSISALILRVGEERRDILDEMAFDGIFRQADFR